MPGLLVGQPGGGLVQQHGFGGPTTARATSSRRRSPAASVPTAAEGSAPSPTNEIGAEHVLAPGGAAHLACSCTIATLSYTDSSSMACSVWNVRRTPHRARR